MRSSNSLNGHACRRMTSSASGLPSAHKTAAALACVHHDSCILAAVELYAAEAHVQWLWQRSDGVLMYCNDKPLHR